MAFSVGGEKEKFYDLFEQKIKSLIPEIEALTGLKVEFFSPDDPREITSNFARLRVVPHFMDEQGDFKARIIYDGFVDTIESYFTTGIRFTPNSITQVDGYIIPDAHNNIALAVCKIDPRLQVGLVDTLITECLFRSVGIPELSHYGNILGAWGANNKDKYLSTSAISAHDRKLIKLLYCAKIKSGMSVYEAVSVLNKSDECFTY